MYSELTKTHYLSHRLFGDLDFMILFLALHDCFQLY